MRARVKRFWQELTIKKKIMVFSEFVFFIILFSVSLEFWLLKFSLVDFRGILGTNAITNQVILTLKEETALFEEYMKNDRGAYSDEEKLLVLKEAIKSTNTAIQSLPDSYEKIGAERFARTQSLKNAYEVYRKARDEMLLLPERSERYIQRLYEVYEMQEYLISYAETLMNMTIEDGDNAYQRKVPLMIVLPYFVIILGVLLLCGMVFFARLMNKSMIEPVLKVVEASKKIAENDFFIDDIVVENEDELGEMVHAFNKMKFATGEYITALEDQRKTLDLLHEEELSKLEMEKQLEVIHLELLKSQIHPHFLFNTLNVIAGMANLEDAQTTEKMIKALSNLFRHNLKTPEVEVELDKELKVLEDYMFLQQMRFGNRISYEINCEVDREKRMVPSFIFQPLAENAIIHGIAPKEDGGKILVHIWEYCENLWITINDTGVGMDEEVLEKLREELSDQTLKETGIGIKNVYQRIKTLYQKSTFEIYSRKEEGTLIKISIPIGGTRESISGR